MTHRTKTRGEDGAVLVLALVFMIVIALVLVGIVTLSGNDLRNTTNLLNQQSVEYRSSGAMDIAIQTVRYTNNNFHRWIVLRARDGDPGGGELAPRLRGLLHGATQSAARQHRRVP